jgi:hypothetical protein
MWRILAWLRFSAKRGEPVAAVGCAWLWFKLVLAIDQERGMSMKNMLLRKVRGDRAAVGLAAIAPILVIAVTLALAPPALAQFTSDSTVMSDPADAAPPTGADPEDAAIPAVADPPADVPVARVTPPPAAVSAAPSDPSAANHSGWDRAGDEETDNSGAPDPDKVLEVPRVVDRGDGQPPAATGQAAPGSDSSSPDQVGSVGDYQDEDDAEIGVGGYISPGAVNSTRVGTVGANPGPLNPPLGSGSVPFHSSGANIALPGANGMNTAIGSTSPMFPSSQGLLPMPGRW